jgi:FMN-dependent NADH-azoreductase
MWGHIFSVALRRGLKEMGMRILQINASARSEGANSTRVANGIVERLRTASPDAVLKVRDLAKEPVPVLDAAELDALFTPAEKRTPGQAASVAARDALIAEVQEADAIVLGVPMYNLGNPVQLKAWIDAIARAGVTFRYTSSGPEGLLKGKTAYVALARGGRYRGTPGDAQTPYLRTVLGFLGITDVRFVYAEGMNMGEEAARQGFAEAEADLELALAA